MCSACVSNTAEIRKNKNVEKRPEAEHVLIKNVDKRLTAPTFTIKAWKHIQKHNTI